MSHFFAAIEDLLKSFGNLFAGVFSTISNVVTGFFTMVAHLLTSFVDLVTGTFKGLVEMIGGLGRFVAGEHLQAGLSLLSSACCALFLSPYTAETSALIADGHAHVVVGNLVLFGVLAVGLVAYQRFVVQGGQPKPITQAKKTT
ncbi:hypothetical protein RB594_007053 [Gaeumannomyces avenae]